MEKSTLALAILVTLTGQEIVRAFVHRKRTKQTKILADVNSV